MTRRYRGSQGGTTDVSSVHYGANTMDGPTQWGYFPIATWQSFPEPGPVREDVHARGQENTIRSTGSTAATDGGNQHMEDFEKLQGQKQAILKRRAATLADELLNGLLDPTNGPLVDERCEHFDMVSAILRRPDVREFMVTCLLMWGA